VAMMHNSLIAYYERIFAFRQYHSWSLVDVENMMPWELDVMMTLLSNYIEKLELDRKQAEVNRGQSL
jgi:uncharacterized membrane protein YoaT (DUF817 family)